MSEPYVGWFVREDEQEMIVLRLGDPPRSLAVTPEELVDLFRQGKNILRDIRACQAAQARLRAQQLAEVMV